MHFMLSKEKVEPFFFQVRAGFFRSKSGSSYEFDFCSRLSPNGLSGNGSMSSAEELFLNGKIHLMKLSSHLKMPQVLMPLVDLGESDDELGEKVCTLQDLLYTKPQEREELLTQVAGFSANESQDVVTVIEMMFSISIDITSETEGEKGIQESDIVTMHAWITLHRGNGLIGALSHAPYFPLEKEENF
ncbi:Molecular chaperone (DnaJ superfamily) [Forsythia ovata]|uniref:Molecular chaperone (DnaJ superfamily) n=1 Tax=Forsythia ovata TaxID=205694 RepID=A0ABD1UXJ4_9LAMI